MKNTVLIVVVLAIVAFACKSKPQAKTPEEEKIETIVKSDSEKTDSVKRYWEEKIRNATDTLSEMPK